VGERIEVGYPGGRRLEFLNVEQYGSGDGLGMPDVLGEFGPACFVGFLW
jgi:hypothetical protein